MTSNARPGTRILGSLLSAGGKAIVRVEDRYDTDIDDLWSALTDPGRLDCWMGEFEGDFRLGGEFRARFCQRVGRSRAGGSVRALAAAAAAADQATRPAG